VDMMHRGDDHRPLGDFIPTREDDIAEGGAAGLKGGIVTPLGFLDVMVQEGEVVGVVGGDLGGVVEVVVDELLEETVLHAGVGD